MNGILGSYLMMGMNMLNEIKTQQENHKKEILVRWQESKNFPRKKKKMVRKRLELEYSIASYDIFKI